MKKLFVLVFLTIFFLHVSKDISYANEEMYKKAESGDANAQYLLGNKYFQGDGIEKSYKQAVYWLEKSAEQGNRDGQAALGLLYCSSMGVSQDYEAGFYWFYEAAVQGHKESQKLVSSMYKAGLGVYPDEYKSVFWGTKDPKIELYESQYLFAKRIYDGEKGVVKNYAQIIYWLEESGNNNNEKALNLLGLIYSKGEGIIVQNDSLSIKWYTKSAGLGNLEAQNILADIYYYGLVTEKDRKQAAFWYEKSAELGQMSSQYKIGSMYYYGNGVSRDTKEAAAWYQKAMDQGSLEAATLLGEIYITGDGAEQDYAQALKILEPVVEEDLKGNGFGEVLVARIHMNAWGVEKNIKEAISFYEKGAKKGHDLAAYELSEIYKKNEEYKNDKKAFLFLKQAAERGHKEAIYALAEHFEKEKNISKAYLWFAIAEINGVKGAGKKKDNLQKSLTASEKIALNYRLGQLFRLGSKDLNIGQNYVAAFDFYTLSSKDGHLESQYNLALLYYEGIEIKRNVKAAFELFEKTAKRGYGRGQYYVGKLYEEGDGIPENKIEAYAWLSVSIENGNAFATKRRNEMEEFLEEEDLNAAKIKAAEYTEKYGPNYNAALKANELKEAELRANELKAKEKEEKEAKESE